MKRTFLVVATVINGANMLTTIDRDNATGNPPGFEWPARHPSADEYGDLRPAVKMTQRGRFAP